MNIDILSEEIKIIAEYAGEYIARVDKLEMWEKINISGGREIVTNIDTNVEKIIISRIRKLCPNALVISEETTLNTAIDISKELCFVVDPIDGTNELIKGSQNFSISIAVLKYGKVICGAMKFPARKRYFQAIYNRGAFLNGNPLRVSTTEDIHRARLAISPSQSKDLSFETVRAKLKGAKLIPIGALTPKIAAVASGEVDAAFYLGSKDAMAAIWDFAAAGIILKEAGGRLTDFNERDLLVELPIIHNSGWIATNGKFHKDLLTLLREK
jgi:myo-inositol-1(or 4)-monophosphatase